VTKKTKCHPIRDYLVQNRESNDQSLHSKLLNVNIRLFNGNREYYSIITIVIEYMKKLLARSFSDYPNLRGISGANIGIPINIIAFVDKKGRVVVMINPLIREYSNEKRTVSSNCGSLVLSQAIKVERSCR